jgi:hypothetical protein
LKILGINGDHGTIAEFEAMIGMSIARFLLVGGVVAVLSYLFELGVSPIS